MDCLFCKIIKGEIPSYKVYEDRDWYAFLDITPVNSGHTLLVPKTHCENIFDLPQDQETSLGFVLPKLSSAVKNGTEADGLNIMMNNGPAAGQIIFHAHWHLIPRFEDDRREHWHGEKDLPKEKFLDAQTKISQFLN